MALDSSKWMLLSLSTQNREDLCFPFPLVLPLQSLTVPHFLLRPHCHSEASGFPLSWGVKDSKVSVVPTLSRAGRVGACLGTHSNLRVSCFLFAIHILLQKEQHMAEWKDSEGK